MDLESILKHAVPDNKPQAHFDAGYVPEHHSRADFASALRAVAEPIFGKSAGETPMSRVLMQLFEVTDLYDMHLQPQLVLLQKTMVQAEGVCRLLTDDHNMWQASGPAVERFMRRELGPQGRIEDLSEAFDRAKSAIKRLPDTLDELTETARVPEQAPRRLGQLGQRNLILGLGGGGLHLRACQSLKRLC